jgi:hypothetical protein
MKPPSIPEVIDKFRNYYRAHPAWGSLHSVLDDGNLSNQSVLFCATWARENGDDEGADLAYILLDMTKTQRGKLRKLIHGEAI